MEGSFLIRANQNGIAKFANECMQPDDNNAFSNLLGDAIFDFQEETGQMWSLPSVSRVKKDWPDF